MTDTSLADVGNRVDRARSGASLRQRRKVFHLVDSLNVGGTETQAVELALRMPSSGYEITLGCLRAEGPLAERLSGSSVAVEEFYPKGGIDSPAGIYQLLRLAAFLRRGRFNVVHTHDLWSNLMGVPAARLAGVAAIVSSQRDLAHFEWYTGLRRILLRRIQKLSHIVLVNATPIREALVAEDSFSPKRLHVIHNGVDPGRFENGKRDRERLFPGVAHGNVVVLVGNMHTDVKGHPCLIVAAPAVVHEFPETLFVFAGDGESRPVFEQQVEALGLQRNFKFLGRRGDIADILASSDIAVLPSKAEGLPNAVLEYMAAGLPVVASRVGGNPELIEDGKTGLLVAAQDSEGLANALLRLLRDPNLSRRLASAGRQRVIHDFGFERLIRQVDELYTKLLHEGGADR